MTGLTVAFRFRSIASPEISLEICLSLRYRHLKDLLMELTVSYTASQITSVHFFLAFFATFSLLTCQDELIVLLSCSSTELGA